MDRTTLRRARWWILGFALLLGVGVGLTVSRAQSDSESPRSNTTSTLAELRDEVRQATHPPHLSVPSTTIPTTTVGGPEAP